MFSLHLFTSAPSTSTSLTNLSAASDPIAAVSGNFLYVPLLNNLIGAFALGADISRAQLQSPSLMAFAPYDISPVNVAALPPALHPMDLKPESPFKLITDEPLQALVTKTSTAQASVFIFLSDGAIAPVSGQIIRARATFTTSATGNSWQNASIALTNQLAEGTYQLVGARLEGAHLIAGRFVFPGGATTIRPGLLAVAAVGTNESRLFRDGRLGVWGTFSNRVLPTIDHITDGNSETATLIMDLIKMG